MSYLNYCRACRTDFASVEAFDRHRVGSHEYTYAQGFEAAPPPGWAVYHDPAEWAPNENGRRCLDPDEMVAAGLELDPRARWRVALTEERRKALARLRDRRENAAVGSDGAATDAAPT